MSHIRAQRIQLIEITIPQNSTALIYNIPDQPMLRNKRIDAIQVLCSDDIANSPITGNAVLPYTEFVTCSPYMSMYSADPVNEADTGEYIYRVPMVSLRTTTGVQLRSPWQTQHVTFDDLFIMWDKSQIGFTTAPNVSGGAKAILLLVFYTSRTQRVTNLLGKKLSGITDGDLAHFLSAKLMQLEQQLQALMSKIKG